MQIILLGIACLGVHLFAKHSTQNMKKMLFDLVGLGGLFFLLTAASGLDYGVSDGIQHLVGLVGAIAPVMGWLCLVGATLLGTLDMLIHAEKMLPH